MFKLYAGASALALLAVPALAHAAEAAPLDQVVVTAAAPQGLDLQAIPTTAASVSADAIARTVNVLTPEDALRYLPNVLIRQRHIGDTQSPITTRTSGVGASARSLIYVDGMLISSLIGNNNTSASPKWGLVSPDSIARVDVLYGPFSAAYAGNSIGSVVAITSRAPRTLEGSLQVQGAGQSFSQYGERRTLGTGRLSADVGDRLGPAAFRLGYNHLDTAAQPLAYATAAVPPSGSPAGTAVSGAVVSASRTGQPVYVLGSTSIEHQVQDNLSGRLNLDLNPQWTAAYAFGLFVNDDRAGASSYLHDGAGAPVYGGTVNIGGRSLAIAPSAFSGGVYRVAETELAQGLSLQSHTDGPLNVELSWSRFDYLSSRQRGPSGALPAGFSGGAGTDTGLDGTGWTTFDAQATWRASAAQTVSFGAHHDGFALANPRYASADWTQDGDGVLQASSAGHTQTQALWAQDAVDVARRVKATVGVRIERWRAFGGSNYSASPALNVQQPQLHADAASPKATLAYEPAPDWTLKASAGWASRFPTVTELYQAIGVGTLLATPNPNLAPERAFSSELSAERRFIHGSLRLSLFDERIANALLSQTAPLPAGSTTLASFVQNVDRTRATGVEVVGEARDLLAPGLRLSGWLTYVDARIERDRAFTAAEGKALPQLPRLRGSATVSWSPSSTVDLSVSARYSDRSFASIDNSDHYADTWQGFDAYLVADVHVRWRINPHLQAGAGIDNLNGRRYFLFHPFPQRTAVADLKYLF